MNKAYALSRFNSEHLFADLKYNLSPPPPKYTGYGLFTASR